jgi:hypothetical protein
MFSITISLILFVIPKPEHMKSSKVINLAIAVTLLFTVLSGCEKKNDTPELVINGNVESGLGVPNSWWQAPELTGFTLAWTDAESFSAKNSLMISRQTATSTDYSYWWQVIYNNIPIGKTLTLKVKIKGVLTGDGVSIAVRTDGATDMLQFVTTEYIQKITGTFDWTEYSIQLPNVVSATESLWVFLIYRPNTSGSVYFDDISLTH